MLDYIYQGEVQVQQEYLDRFLEIAAKFKLSGLLTTDEEGEEKAEDIETLQETTENEYRHHEIVPEDYKKNKLLYQEGSINPIYVENAAEIEQKFAELIEKDEDGLHRCTVCEKKFKVKRDMVRLFLILLGPQQL